MADEAASPGTGATRAPGPARVVGVDEGVERVAGDQRGQVGRQPDLGARALAEQRQQFEAHHRVETVGRFVEDEQLGSIRLGANVGRLDGRAAGERRDPLAARR